MRTLIVAVFSLFLSLLVALPAPAQTSATTNSVAPLTRDPGALITNTARAASTANSADQSGFGVSRVVCVFNQSTYTGAPSTTFAIQNKDAASGLYYTLITSAAVTTAVNTPSAISAGSGVPTTTNVSANIPVARTWRVTETIGGTSTPTVTGTVGCSIQ